MVDPVEDIDDSATTDDQAPLVDPVEETDESAPVATEESAPADEATSVPADATDGAPVEEFVPGIKVVPGDASATIYWPDFGAEKNYVVQFEKADGSWKALDAEVAPSDNSTGEPLISAADNQATVEDLRNGKAYTVRIVSAGTVEQAKAATADAVDLTPGGPRGALAHARLVGDDVPGTVAVASPPMRITPQATGDFLITLVARSCAPDSDPGTNNYKNVRANRARNNIQESLKNLGPDSNYTSSMEPPVNPVNENASPQDVCQPITNWPLTFGDRIDGKSPPPLNYLSKVGNQNGTYRTLGSTPELNSQGNPTGRDVLGAVTVPLTDAQAALAARSTLWVMGGTPNDPLAEAANGFGPANYAFGALRCAYDALNGDNVEFVNYRAGVRHVFCYAIYLTPPEPNGQITIRKVATGGTGGESFGFQGSVSFNPGGTFSLMNGEAFSERRSVGSWFAEETTLPSGWALERIDCSATTGTGTTVVVDPQNPRRVNITLAANGRADCTYYNTRDTATLTLVKEVSGGPALPTAWTLTAAGPTTITGVTGASTVTGATVPTGTFNLSESGGPAGYSPSSAWVCTGTGQTQTATSVTLTKGANATCKITNTRDTAELLLVKQVVGFDPADPDQWDLSATGPQGSPGVQNEGGSGVLTEVWSGVGYTLGESDGPANYSPSAWVCEPFVAPEGDDLQRLDDQADLGFVLNGDTVTLDKGASVVCTIVNTRDTAEVKLQKAWVNARGGDTAALTIKGGLPESGAPNKASTATGATGTVLDATNVANATVQVGDTVNVSEVLGEKNAGKYGSTLACTAGDVKVKVDDKGNFTMPDAAVTCTFTNDRSVAVPTQPTVTAEICDPNVPGAQLPGSITIPANPDYAYFIEGVATAAGNYPKPAGSYKVTAQLIVTKPVSASALQQLAAQDVFTWTVVIPGSPVCPILTKESTPASGQPATTGEIVTYTVTVKNGGDTAVVGETLVDTLPAGVELITTSINPSSGVYNSTARTITWKFDLPAAVGTTPATATFTYQVTVTASSGSIVNSVSWVERSLTATTTNPVTPGTVGGIEETPDEPDSVVGGTEDLPNTGADDTVNVAGFGLLAMVLGGLMVGFGRRRRREQ